jgi:hypothetical protein
MFLLEQFWTIRHRLNSRVSSLKLSQLSLSFAFYRETLSRFRCAASAVNFDVSSAAS